MSKVIIVAPNGEIMQWQNREELNYAEAPEGMQEYEVTDKQFDEAVEPSWYVDGEVVTADPNEATPNE